MYDKLLEKIKIFIGLIDESSRLVFLRNLLYECSKSGTELIEYLYSIIDAKTIERIKENNENIAKIEEE